MRLNTVMPSALKKHYRVELSGYKLAIDKNNFQLAWRHLERAHVLGQAYPLEHSLAHWKMLKFGFRIKNTREILGQLPRLLVGGVKSFVGKIPVGNTGGANVPPLKSLPIEPDLAKIFQEAGVQ
ncbi:DUF3703 domain-containing protein [Halocola ammonii]